MTLKQQIEYWKQRAEIAEAKCSSMRSDKWPAAKRAHLKIEPDCQACGTKECLEVHHIAPFATHHSMELDPKNLLTLCEYPDHLCHLRVGHCPRGDTKPSWRKINPFVREDAAAMLAKVKK